MVLLDPERRTTLVGVMLMACAGLATAEPLALYVSPGGNDTWSGRRAEIAAPDGPFATLARARDELRALRGAQGLPEGAVVNVLPGLYELRETLTLGPEDSGTEQAPIVYRGAGDEKPILTGGRALTGWRELEDGIVWCDLKANELAGKPISVFVFGGALQTLARYPNFDPNDPHQGAWAYVASVEGSENRAEFRYGEDETHAWEHPEDAAVHIHPYFDWAWNIVKLKAHDPATRTLTLADKVSYALHIGDRYFLDNLFEELDAPGEWYRDPRTEAFYFKPPRPIDEAAPVAAALDDIVVMEGAQHITLRGLVLECCNGTPVRINNSQHCAVVGSIVRNCGGWGVSISGGEYSGARGNDVYDCGHGGISVTGGSRDTLEPGRLFADNNYVHHCARVWKTYRPGISVNGVGNTVSHNLIHDMPHAALLLGGNDNVVELNHVRHCNLESADTGGIYFCSRDWTQRGNVIRHNLFHHCGGFGKANSWAPLQGGKVTFEYPHFTWGIYLDDPTTGTLVYGNIVYAAPICGLHNHGGRDNVWENNIVVDAPAFNAGMLSPDWSEWPPIKDRLHKYQQPGSPYLT
ncbi:MAG: right-handed parallel beta-helix repeat-containing protein, partial [Armatimonadetes bacterium]|nr:right-handed parallel beta-helix repeat-containing protein [Armatimonadota bacterium]